MEPKMKDIKQAHERFRDVIPSSPLIPSRYLSQLLGPKIFLKLENLQETGSFKVRGAYNRQFCVQKNGFTSHNVYTYTQIGDIGCTNDPPGEQLRLTS